jgi:hypothetical protein
MSIRMPYDSEDITGGTRRDMQIVELLLSEWRSISSCKLRHETTGLGFDVPLGGTASG